MSAWPIASFTKSWMIHASWIMSSHPPRPSTVYGKHNNSSTSHTQSLNFRPTAETPHIRCRPKKSASVDRYRGLLASYSFTSCKLSSTAFDPCNGSFGLNVSRRMTGNGFDPSTPIG
ncbi:uncharacterized protein EI90DRAFT_3030418 [Cantharellus anzutake]|uniref:uncharacterized protein n=1 Tax=Cantharellus anzutake TaxID=1750568 RepID=UPI00190331A5|nr:uncharacterized protein EI90DRAFT_3030418 [Cantharellus anzutake]KAF8342846.1 hypothetical protein EI90DRAFT_3030418 [Cantharellus anzutake]